MSFGMLFNIFAGGFLRQIFPSAIFNNNTTNSNRLHPKPQATLHTVWYRLPHLEFSLNGYLLATHGRSAKSWQDATYLMKYPFRIFQQDERPTSSPSPQLPHPAALNMNCI